MLRRWMARTRSSVAGCPSYSAKRVWSQSAPRPKPTSTRVGHSRRTLRADLVRSVRPRIVAAGIATESELDELDHAIRDHLDNPAR
jgi:hypothetical protein